MRNRLWALVLLCAAFLGSGVWGDIVIYENGAQIASCERTEAPAPPTPAPPPVPPPTPAQIFTWSHETRGDNAPLNPQPLYDQAVISPGQIYIEALVGRVHRVDFFNGAAKLRTERYYPYTHWAELTPGEYHLIAYVYSDDQTLAATHEVKFFVADGGASLPTEHNVVVEWIAPTTRENGEPLSSDELSRYRLRYGDVETFVDAPNTRIELNLPSGEYEFTVSAIDTDGLESDPSNPVAIRL